MSDEPTPVADDGTAEAMFKANQLIPEEEHRLRTKDGIQPPEIELRPAEEERLLEADFDNITSEGNVRQRKHKPHTKFTDELKARFVELLARYGVKYKVAKAVGVSVQTTNDHMQDDEEFAEACGLAMGVFRDSIEETIIDRAIHGWKEPVFSQRLGTRIGWIHRFDNRLLELLAKRHIPEYRDKQQVDVNVSGGVLISPSEPKSVEDWKQRHTLPEPSEQAIIDAEVTEVKEKQ